MEEHTMRDSSKIEDVDIRAVWDGVEDHAVQVNLFVRVRTLPGTRHVLLHGCGMLVEEATVTNVREVLPPSTESKALEGSWQSDEPILDTPKKLETEPADQTWTLETPHRKRLATLYGDITTSKSFSAAAATRRWEEIKTDNALDSSILCRPGSDGGELPYETNNSNREFFTPLGKTTSGNTVSLNNTYGSVDGTLDKPPAISLCDSPTGLIINKRQGGARRTGSPRRKLPSYFFHDKGRSELNARLRLGLEIPPWSTAPRTKVIKANSSGISARKPWRVPGLSDISPRSNALAALSPRSAAARKLASQSLEITRLTKCNPSVASSLRKYQSQETFLVARHDTSINVKTNNKNLSKSSRSLSCSSCASYSHNSMTSSTSVSKAPDNSKNEQRNPEIDDIEKESKRPGYPKKSVSSTTEPFNQGIRSLEALQGFTVSPPISLRPWLRYRGTSTQHLKYLPQPSRNELDRFSWAIESGDLYIEFVDDGKPSIFEVDIEAKIRLTPTVVQHQYSFHVPGLPQAENRGDRNTTGGFAFFLDPTFYDPVPFGVRFTAKGLEDCRIKESSHVIGRFRLDESPLLYMQVKVPIYHISEISSNVVMCASLVHNPKGGLMVNYKTRLMCDTSATDVYAHQVEFFFVVKYGFSEAGSPIYQIDNGSCTTVHETVDSLESKAKIETLLRITQNVETFQNAITITFSIPYRAGCHAMPLFRPYSGSTSAETILLTCPRLPLIFEHVPKEPLSTWKALHYVEAGHRIIKLVRRRMPKFFPEGLNDDPLMRISELYRVQFTGRESADNAWENASPVSVARHMQITLYETLGGHLECRLNIDAEFGKNAKVLMIDAHGWQPCYSTIDGHLATEESGEWREMDNTCLALFKTASMSLGNIVHVVFHFRRRIEAEALHETDNKPEILGCAASSEKFWLPKIVGKTVLGSEIHSDLKDCTVRLTDELESGILTQRLQRNDQNKLSLPKLSPNYELSIEYEGSFRDHELFLPKFKVTKSHPIKPALCGTTSSATQSKLHGDSKVHFVDEIEKPPAAGNDGGSVKTHEPKTMDVSDLIECPDRALPAIKAMGNWTDTLKTPDAPTAGHRIGWKTVVSALLAALLTLHYEDGMRLSLALLRRNDTPHQLFNFTNHNSQSLHAPMVTATPAPISSTSVSISVEQVSSSYTKSTDAPVIVENQDATLATILQAPEMDGERAGKTVHRQRVMTLMDRIDYALGWRGQ